MKLTSLSVCAAAGLLAGVLSAATVTSNATCSAEQEDGSTKTISGQSGCNLNDPETATVFALIENNSDANGGLLRLTTTATSFALPDGTARSGEAIADISFTDLFATAGPERAGLIEYRFHVIATGGDLTGRADIGVRFGSDVDFEFGSGGADPLTKIVESGGLIPFQLGRNVAIELTLQSLARTFFDSDEVNSFAESASIQIEREFRFFETDGVTRVGVVGAHPEVPEPATFVLAGLGLVVVSLRRRLLGN